MDAFTIAEAGTPVLSNSEGDANGNVEDQPSEAENKFQRAIAAWRSTSDRTECLDHY